MLFFFGIVFYLREITFPDFITRKGLVPIIHFLTYEWKAVVVVVVRIFNATRHPRHIEAATFVMYMYLYSLAFMDHPCTLGAAVCHQAPPCPLYTQPRVRRVWARRTNVLKIVSVCCDASIVVTVQQLPTAFYFTSCDVMLAVWSPSTAAHFAFCFTSCD